MSAAAQQNDGTEYTADRRGRFWSVVFMFIVVAWHGIFVVRPARLECLAIREYPLFIDSLALLSAGEAAHLGYDVHHANPLDPFRRPHSYPSYWLLLGDLGLTRADNRWFGPLTLAVFGLALGFVLRPRTFGQCLEAAVVACAPGVMLAVVRANNDLWVFAVLSLLVPVVMARQRLVRMLAPFLVAAGTAMKYYPAIAGIVLLTEPSRRDRWMRVGVLAALLAIVGCGVIDDLRHFGATEARVDRFFSFGAPDVLRQFGFSGSALITLSAGLGAAAALAGVACFRRRTGGPRFDVGVRADLYFVLGAAVLAGCFWAGANWGYRWVFGLWLLPGFWRGLRSSIEGSHPLAIGLLRWSWWLPLWFEPLYFVTKKMFLVPDWVVWPCWWTCQMIDWLWFSGLTALAAGFVWRRIFDGEQR